MTSHSYNCVHPDAHKASDTIDKPHLLYLALGSNLGNRAENIERAIRLIDERIGRVVVCSGNQETAPVGFESSNSFLNAAVAVDTNQPVDRVLCTTQEIERELGRTHKSVQGIYHDRTIDIDLLLYGETVVQTDTLCLPHPHLHERRFVLEPLHRIAPDVKHPVLHATIANLLERMNQGRIREAQLADCTQQLQQTMNHLLPQLWDEAPKMTLDRLHKLLQAPNIHLYLLYNETNEFCAMATLAVDCLPTGYKSWIEDVVVDAACRGRGYGRQLIEHLIAEASRLGAQSINLTSRPERRAANRLYRSLGFKQRDTNVYKLSLSTL